MSKADPADDPLQRALALNGVEHPELHDRLGYLLAQSRCNGLGAAHQPCGLHLSRATRDVREVLGVAETLGWALRKVHGAPGESIEEIVSAVERGAVTH